MERLRKKEKIHEVPFCHLAVLFALVFSSMTLATTKGAASAITGAVNPATTELGLFVSQVQILEIVAVLPVVSTVTGTPASIAASVNSRSRRSRCVGAAAGPIATAKCGPASGQSCHRPRDTGGERLSGNQHQAREYECFPD